MRAHAPSTRGHTHAHFPPHPTPPFSQDDNDKIQKAKRFIEKLTGMRRQTKGGGKEYEYETKWKNIDLSAASWLTASKLIKAGWEKHVKAVDQKIAMMAGMYIRPLTTANVEKHLEDVGLDREVSGCEKDDDFFSTFWG